MLRAELIPDWTPGTVLAAVALASYLAGAGTVLWLSVRLLRRAHAAERLEAAETMRQQEAARQHALATLAAGKQLPTPRPPDSEPAWDEYSPWGDFITIAHRRWIS